MKKIFKKTAQLFAILAAALTFSFGLMANTATDTGTETGTGSEAGTGSDVETGTDTGASGETGTDTGSDVETGTDTGASGEAGTDTGASGEAGTQETYAITYDIGENGNVTCSHDGSALSGEEVTFTLKPALGYEVENFFINDVPMPLTAENTYTHTIYYDLHVVATFKAFSVEEGSIFKDGLSNGRIDVAVTDTTQTLTLGNADGEYSNTRAVYYTPLDLTSFEMTFTLDSIPTDGAFRISFLSSANDFPIAGYGDGFGIYFWDETAWGYTDRTSLRCDYYTYSKENMSATLSEAKALGCEAGNAWRGQSNYVGMKINIRVTIGSWNGNDGVMVHIYGNDKYEQGGMFAFNTLPSTFDYTNCYMVISPDIDISRPHSYDTDVKLTFDAARAKPDEGGNEGAVDPVEYSITYYDNDTIIRVAFANEGDKFYNYIPPEKEGFEFDGWYLDKECTEIYNIAKVATEDVVVYAKYVPIGGVNTGTTNGTNNSSESGCTSSLGGVAVCGMIAAVGALALKKRKEN